MLTFQKNISDQIILHFQVESNYVLKNDSTFICIFMLQNLREDTYKIEMCKPAKSDSDL